MVRRRLSELDPPESEREAVREQIREARAADNARLDAEIYERLQADPDFWRKLFTSSGARRPQATAGGAGPALEPGEEVGAIGVGRDLERPRVAAAHQRGVRTPAGRR